jgi:hypothetical protein
MRMKNESAPRIAPLLPSAPLDAASRARMGK